MLTRLIKDETPVHEITDSTKFRRIMQTRVGQRVKIVVQVAPAIAPGHTEPRWWDFMEFWEGVWSNDLPIPTEPVLQMCIAQAGAVFARPVIRAVI